MDFELKGTVMGQKKTEKNRSVNKTEKQAVKERSRTVSGILAILLGALGIQKFYRGQWKQGIIRPDTWWYENADGTWLANTWAWIDGNNDGVYECYYFDKDGWMIYNAESPDHWVTNADGCWTLAGVVQTR